MFTPDPHMESRLRLLQENPEKFSRLDLSIQRRVKEYASRKAASNAAPTGVAAMTTEQKVQFIGEHGLDAFKRLLG